MTPTPVLPTPEAAVAAARAAGAARIDLLSNTALGPAVALYRTLGFVEVPLPATEYARANIAMVLDLMATPPRSRVRFRDTQHPSVSATPPVAARTRTAVGHPLGPRTETG